MKRVMIPALTALMLVASGQTPMAAEALSAEPACLNAAGIQEALVAGRAQRLAEIRRKLKGDIVRADLCHDNGKLAYLVTILTPDGMVRRVTVDASSGEMLYAKH
jgi:uncharacterized membrane protein YkoI